MSKKSQPESDGPTGVAQVDAYLDTRMTPAEQVALASEISGGDVAASQAIVDKAVKGKKR